jgi:hypothetical protein
MWIAAGVVVAWPWLNGNEVSTGHVDSLLLVDNTNAAHWPGEKRPSRI